MAEFRSIAFNNPESYRLADLAGVETDLLTAERFCDRYLAESKKEKPEWELLEIICTAAIVRYGRSFNSGTRDGLSDKVLNQLLPEYRVLHERFKNLRNRWVAHSVNEFEVNEVALWLAPPGRGPMGILSVSVKQQRVTSLGFEEMQSLKNLCAAVREHLKFAIDLEKERVLAIVRALPVESFYSQVDSASFPNTAKPSKARARK